MVFCVGAASAAENTNSHLNDNTNVLSLSDNLNQNEIENGVISNSEDEGCNNDMSNQLIDSSDTLNANDLSNSLGPLGVNENDVSSDIGLNDDHSNGNVDDDIEIANGKISLQSSPDISILTASNILYVGQNITEGGTIKILDGVYAGVNNTGITISVKGLTIEAVGDNVVFDGNFNSNKFFTVNSNNVTIKGITFKDTGGYSNGGAIYWSGTNGTIDSCKFIDTNVSSSYYGGAVYWKGANGNIKNTDFSDISASDGGAVYWSGNDGTISNCHFDKIYSNGFGGAVYWSGARGTITDSEFNDTKSEYNGGAVLWIGKYGTIDNSEFNNNNVINSSYAGGAVYWYASNGVLNNSQFNNNYASHGGAVGWNGANGVLSDSNFTNNAANNTSTSKGGAVYWNAANGNINNCSFENNTVNTTSSSSFGGAVYINGGSTTINGSSFEGNDAFSGGSLYVAGSSVNVNNSNFNDDYADHFGGSIYWNGGSGRLVNSTISNSTANHMGGAVFWSGSSGRIDGSNLTDNYASDGGAIYDTGSDLTVANSNLKDNEARYGGAIFTTASSLSIQGSNITDNHANITAGGIANRYAFTNTSSIIVNNTPEDRAPISPDGSAFVYVNSSSSSSYNNASLSDGYFGYCINSHREYGTGKGTPLTVASMSEVTNSVNGLPVGEYLKILFYNYYESVNQNRIWILTDENFFKSNDPIIKKVIEDYNSGLRIPDHGAKKRVNKTSYRYYDFESLLSTNVANQNLFGYKVSYEDIIFNISVVKESLNKTVYEDQQTEFDIRVTNTGNYLLEDVFVLEDKYDGLVFDHYEDPEGNWNFDEQLHKWVFKGVLDVGETTTIRVVFNVTSPGNFTNFIVAGANETDNKTTNNTTQVYNSSLIVEKITLTPKVPVGNQTQFMIVVTNTGDSDLDGVYVKETSYEGLVYDSFIDPSGKWSYDGNNCWNYEGILESGASANFTVVFYTVTPGNFTNIVVAGSNHTNETTANNTTEVFNDTKEDTNKTDKEEKHFDKETKVTKVVTGVTAGNPLLVLILSLISLCIVPLNRKK